jgi:DUF1365 family protein
MGMRSKLIDCKVSHKRFSPKEYFFKNKYFWFKLDLDELDEISQKISFFSRNTFNLYQFNDNEHIKLGKNTARENYVEFVRQNGVEEKIVKVELYTNVSFLGYVFNPVSFICLEGESGKPYGIIEIGNTFNELKPYFVPSESFDGHGYEIETPKLFYISPFIDFDTRMIFKFKRSEEGMQIFIDDFKGEEKILTAAMAGKEIELTNDNLMKMTLKHPLVTWGVIFMIHYHALKLYLKKLPFYKKNQHPELQQGSMIWKESLKH